jgi:hypothetical protein
MNEQQNQNLASATVRNKLSGAEYEVQGKDAIERLMSDENIEVLSSTIDTQTEKTAYETAPQTVSVGSGDTSEMAGVSYNEEFAVENTPDTNGQTTQAKRTRKSSQNTSENQSNSSR